MRLIRIDDKYFNPSHIVSIKPEYVIGADDFEKYRINFVDGSFYFIDKGGMTYLLEAFDVF